MSGRRSQDVNKVEFQEIWRNQKSADPPSSYLGKGSSQTDTPLKPRLELEPQIAPVAIDKQEIYPPIVTIDGRVDTDIDHLIEDLTDDYTGPVDEIPSKFPKPHVFSVIEGSLDDDVDSYANDDGTMEHTLVDSPNMLKPSDLKDVASKESSRHPPEPSKIGQIRASHSDRSYNKMYQDPTEHELVREEAGDHTRERLKADYSDEEETASEGSKKPPKKSAGNAKLQEKRMSRKREATCDKATGESASEEFEVTKQQMDHEADYPPSSRAVVTLKCDSSSHAADLKTCRTKDVFLQTYTESLPCTFTEESLRDGLDMSVLRVDQSVFDTDTELKAEGSRDLCHQRSDEGYIILENKPEMELESKSSQCQCGETKRSNGKPRISQVKQGVNPVPSSNAQHSHSNPSASAADFMRNSQSSITESQNDSNTLVTSSGCNKHSHCQQGSEEKYPPGRIRYSSDVEPNSSRLKCQRASPATYSSCSPSECTQADGQADKGRPSPKEVVFTSENKGNVQRFNERVKQLEDFENAPIQPKSSLRVSARAGDPRQRVRTRNEAGQEELLRSVTVAEPDTQAIRKSRRHSGSETFPGVEQEETCDFDDSLAREHGVQVKMEKVSRTKDMKNEFAQQTEVSHRDKRYQSEQSESSIKCKRMQELSNNFCSSDTESLDSESQHLLQQLQVAQLTKRNTNTLLKHVQNILCAPEKTGESFSKAAGRSMKSRGHNSSLHSNPEEKNHENSVYAANRNERFHKSPDRNDVSLFKRERKTTGLNFHETTDKGLVQTLVSTWDKHHRGCNRDKGPATADSQLKKTSNNRWTGNVVSDSKDRSDTTTTAGVSRSSLVHKSRRSDNSQHCISEQEQIRFSEPTERHLRRSSQDKMLQCQSNTSPGSGPARKSTSRKSESFKSPSSSSLHSDSSDSASNYRDISLTRAQPRAKCHKDEALVKRAQSQPNKSVHKKRRVSPDSFGYADVHKWKRRHEMDAKRSSSIKDSLRAAFKVAEESMSAAARVAEALNIVMKASQISPASSSCHDQKYGARDEDDENSSPELRPKRRIRSNYKSSNQQEGPQESSRSRNLEKDSWSMSRTADKKKRIEQARSNSLEPLQQNHKTSLSSPSKRDTYIRSPKNSRANQNQQVNNKPSVPDSKRKSSRSSLTMKHISPQVLGDVSKIDRVLQADPEAVSQVTYSKFLDDPHVTCESQTAEDLVEVRKRLAQNTVAKEEPSHISLGTDKRNVSKTRLLHVSDEHGPRDKCPEVAEVVETSTLMHSGEDWMFPNSSPSGRKADSYFMREPPIIDQNLQSISMSAKQIIRRQLVGSRVDPGLTDSPGSDSIEYNSNFNKSITSRKLRWTVRPNTEPPCESSLDMIIMNNYRQEMDVSESFEQLWVENVSMDHDASNLSIKNHTNVSRPTDCDKNFPAVPRRYQKEKPNNCYLQTRTEGHNNRQETVHRLDKTCKSYLLHEDVRRLENERFQRPCTQQVSPDCEVCLCYSDQSSPPSSCQEELIRRKYCGAAHGGRLSWESEVYPDADHSSGRSHTGLVSSHSALQNTELGQITSMDYVRDEHVTFFELPWVSDERLNKSQGRQAVSESRNQPQVKSQERQVVSDQYKVKSQECQVVSDQYQVKSQERQGDSDQFQVKPQERQVNLEIKDQSFVKSQENPGTLQAGPTPKPRASKTPTSDEEDHSGYRRNFLVPKFSPIYEEYWSDGKISVAS